MSITVTVENGRTTRRYVVEPEDEHLFDGVPTGKVPAADSPDVYKIRQAREDHLGRFHFGCRWLRGPGRLDEQYRTLGSYEVLSVARKP